MSRDDCLIGEVTVEQVKGWSDTEWRVFQFNHMLSTNLRLSKLEHQASWRNILVSIPWAIVGALVAVIAK